MVIDKANKNAANACLYDITKPVPEFVYSNKNHYVDLNSESYLSLTQWMPHMKHF